nr:cysteine peptidase family C39 domain-containing protein [Alicyclobacillus acidiphilus]
MPACVLALGEYYCLNLSLNEIRILLVTSPSSGTTLKNLYNLSPWFYVQLGRITELSEISTHTPFIAFLKHNHAVTIWGYTQDGSKLVVGDPGVGIVQMNLDELLRVWDGIVAVLRPKALQDAPQERRKQQRPWQQWQDRLGFTDLQSFGVNWWPMGWTSLLVLLTGITNSIYSLYYAKYLPLFGKFILFVLSYTAISTILSWITNLILLRTSVKYQKVLSWRLDEAMKNLNLTFYTMGDISTRYQDASTVVSAVMALFQNIPYSLVIFLTSLYFLAKINWLLPVFTIVFLVLIVSILTPFVQKVRNLLYSVRLKQAEMTNRLQSWLTGGENTVTTAFQELVNTQYKQSLWSMPIRSVVGNSIVIPTLFVVIFDHWSHGAAATSTTKGYSQLLTAIMIMNYAVSAGHNLYGAIISWQTSRPSLQRLKDFLSVDVEHGADSPIVASEDSSESFIASTAERGGPRA